MADAKFSENAKASAETAERQIKTAIGLLQHSVARMMRANERIIHGSMSAAKLQIDAGQEVLRRRMDRMQTTKLDTAPHTIIEHQTQDMQRMMSAMREVSEEMRVTFAEAATLLFDGAQNDLDKAQSSANDFVRQSEDLVKKGHHEAGSVTSKVVHKAAAKPEHQPAE